MIRCFHRIREHVEKNGLNIPYERLKDFAYLLDREKADSLTNAEFIDRANELINEHLQRASAKVRAANALILAKRQAVMERVMDTSKGSHLWENIAYWVGGGSNRPGWDTNRDPKKVAATIKADLLRLFRRTMEPIKDAVANGALDRETYKELWAIDQLEPLGKSGSSIALEQAKGIQDVNNQIFNLSKAYNPFMERTTEYLTKRFHDREKVAAVEKQEWVKDAMQWFGERSFPELKTPEKEMMLSSVYDRIKDGTYGGVTDDSESDKFITVKGSGANVMKKMARSRSLVANDADAAFEYNLKYGYGTLAETMERVVSNASKDIAVLEKFGPNARGTYEGVYTRALAKAPAEEKQKLKDKKRTLDRLFDEATGATNVPARSTGARIAQGYLNVQYAAKGGSALIRAQLDLASAASLIRGLNGKSIPQNGAEIALAYAKNMATIFKGDGAKIQAAMEPLLIFSSSAQSALMQDLGMQSSSPGVTAKITEAISTVSGIRAHVDALRLGIGSMIAAHMGEQANTPYLDLSGRMQKGLLRYGMGEHEWNTLRQGVNDWSALDDGTPLEQRKILDATGIDSIPDEIIADYLTMSGQSEKEPSDEAIFLARKELTYKYGTLINEHADLGVVHGGSRQRAFLLQGTTPDDPLGIALRLATQFKMAGLTQWDNVKRGLYSGEGPRGDWSGTAQTVAFLLFLGAFSVAAYELKQGKTPEAVNTPEFAAKAAAASGAGFLYSDTLINMMGKNKLYDMKSELLRSLAGPAANDLLQGAAVTAKAAKSAVTRDKFPTKQAVDLGLGLIPGQNLLWSQAAFNFYVTNGIKDFLTDGYLNRLQWRTESTPGLLEKRQRYLMFKPTDSPRWPKKLLGN